jgi:hypothetical protein
MDNREIARLGEDAKEMAANPAWSYLVETVPLMLMRQWGEEQDPQTREKLWYTLQGLNEFVDGVEETVANGYFAQRQIDEESK